MSSFEHNRESLKKALEQLQSYDPPTGSWDQIQSKLSEETSEQEEEVLREAVQHLPAYTPPVSVWNKLTKQLDGDRQVRHLRVVRRRQVLQWAAAVVLLVLSAYFVIREPGPNVKLLYDEVVVQAFEPAVDWNGEENIFAQLEQQLGQVNNPDLNQLRFEYEELSTAHQDVAAILKSYGRDPQLIRQMADIERERSDIYRRIIEAI